jgi:phosphoribosyl-dephospho-CoA transferase
VRVHDLLWISKKAELFSESQPDWVSDALTQCPVVVVRRAAAPVGFVPVGVRGATRSQRFASLLSENDVLGCKAPENLAAESSWRNGETGLSERLIETLHRVSEAAQKIGLTWGPTGSVGHQLATGMLSTNLQSDLDVVVRCTDSLKRAQLQEFYTAIQMTPVGVDVVLESPEGAVALAEYLQHSFPIVKTAAGPRLMHFSW